MGSVPFAGFDHDDFEFLYRPVEERTWEQHDRLRGRMLALEAAIDARLGADQRRQLGGMKVGRLELDARSAWLQTHEGTDGVNLTIELWGTELQLDLVAWRVPQAELFRSWLETSTGAAHLRALDGFAVTVFLRRAHAGPSGAPYWRRETFRDVARVDARYPETLRSAIATLDGTVEATWEKLAFHLRYAWPRHRVVERSAGVLDGVLPRLLALAPLVAEINAQADATDAAG